MPGFTRANRGPGSRLELALLNRHAQILTLCAALIAAGPARATAPTPAGTVPPEVSEAFERGVFSLPERAATGTSVAQSAWRVPVIMVSFSDDTLAYTPQDFNLALFDTTHSTPTGSAYDYYRWVSRGAFKLTGEVVAVVRLPQNRFYYGYNSWGLNTTTTPANVYGAIFDALTIIDTSKTKPRWADFDLDHDGFVDMVWLLHSGKGGEGTGNSDRNAIWSMTSRMSAWGSGRAFETHELVPGSISQHMRLDRFSSVPELSMFHPGRRSEIGVFCHEFGHALGLPDLYDTRVLGGGANVGPGDWTLMSTGAFGADGFSADYPSHMGAWALNFLGWSSLSQPIDDASVSLPPIEQDGSVIQFSFQGEPTSEHFLIENRQRMGFDPYLPAPGLIVCHVDEAQIGSALASNRINAGLTPGLIVVEADGHYDMMNGVNRGDIGDPFPGVAHNSELNDDTSPSTRTFSGAANNIALGQITPAGSNMNFQLQVRAPGWLPLEDHSDALFNPVTGSSAASTVTVDVLTDVTAVAAELRASVPQIVLRERQGGAWSEAVQLSHAAAGAYEPTLAALGGGDVFVAWRDMRDGAARIYSRTRIGGVWTAEEPVAGVPANSFEPAISTDGHGMIYMTWLSVILSRPRVMFMRFAYTSPFGQPAILSSALAYPDAPTITSGVDGRAFVLWPDRATVPQTVFYCSYRPDSGVSVPLQLGPTSGNAQVTVSAALDASGTLHSIWEEISGGIGQLHYQRRRLSGLGGLPDTTIEAPSWGLLAPSMALDPSGGVHVVFETSVAGIEEVRYKHWISGRGWDAISTEVTRPTDGSARQPRVGASSRGNVTVLFNGYPAGQPRFISRDRVMDGIPVAGVEPSQPIRSASLTLGPNPLRAGTAFEIAWSGAEASRGCVIEFFDLSGRRVASVPLAGSGVTRRARVGASTTASWPAGLYFARAQGAAISARLVVLR